MINKEQILQDFNNLRALQEEKLIGFNTTKSIKSGELTRHPSVYLIYKQLFMVSNASKNIQKGKGSVKDLVSKYNGKSHTDQKLTFTILNTISNDMLLISAAKDVGGRILPDTTYLMVKGEGVYFVDGERPDEFIESVPVPDKYKRYT